MDKIKLKRLRHLTEDEANLRLVGEIKSEIYDARYKLDTVMEDLKVKRGFLPDDENGDRMRDFLDEARNGMVDLFWRLDALLDREDILDVRMRKDNVFMGDVKAGL